MDSSSRTTTAPQSAMSNPDHPPAGWHQTQDHLGPSYTHQQANTILWTHCDPQSDILGFSPPMIRPTPARDTQCPEVRGLMSWFHPSGARTSPRTQWALAPPTSRPTPALSHHGTLSQPPQDPAPFTVGPTPALRHPETCSQSSQEMA